MSTFRDINNGFFDRDADDRAQPHTTSTEDES